MTCKCGSSTHQRTNHAACPLNRRRRVAARKSSAAAAKAKAPSHVGGPAPVQADRARARAAKMHASRLSAANKRTSTSGPAPLTLDRTSGLAAGLQEAGRDVFTEMRAAAQRAALAAPYELELKNIIDQYKGRGSGRRARNHEARIKELGEFLRNIREGRAANEGPADAVHPVAQTSGQLHASIRIHADCHASTVVPCDRAALAASAVAREGQAALPPAALPAEPAAAQAAAARPTSGSAAPDSDPEPDDPDDDEPGDGEEGEPDADIDDSGQNIQEKACRQRRFRGRCAPGGTNVRATPCANTNPRRLRRSVSVVAAAVLCRAVWLAVLQLLLAGPPQAAIFLGGRGFGRCRPHLTSRRLIKNARREPAKGPHIPCHARSAVLLM
jgi:hypothetical protein